MTTGDEEASAPTCAEEGCERDAAVRLHVPWAANRDVCVSHARTLAQQDGVVAEPLEGSDAWDVSDDGGESGD
ncbi:MAG: hypothetical protein ABEJ22_04910 [Haloferacaceae archaeon]